MDSPIIIALSGRKGAGKNEIAKFIKNYVSVKMLKIPNATANRVKDFGDMKDFTPITSTAFIECSFADNIKEFCINTLGLKKSQCDGTDEEKNSPTSYLWENVPDHLRKRNGPITGREVMQLFGTELIRNSFGNVWADATIRKIKRSGKPIAIITDNRFPNEVDVVLKQKKGHVIRLTRSPFGTKDMHLSESSLDEYNWDEHPRCFVVDNSKLGIERQNDAIIPILNKIFGLKGG